jgi:diguanylate cyclase (GGDEF)-like protein
MPRKVTDFRIVEMKLLENLADGKWASSVSFSESGGQANDLGVTRGLYVDMIMTMLEDGYLYSSSSRILMGVTTFARSHNPADRQYVCMEVLRHPEEQHHITVTYRGLRRIEELREQLRRDRILEKFGILLDGRYIVSDLIEFLARASGESVSMLLADVDDFKLFNSNFGYKAGDAVLCHVFRTFHQIVGAAHGDGYRRGGEEIVGLLPYCDLNTSTEIAERIRKQIANEPLRWEGQELSVTISIGVAASPPENSDGPELELLAENRLKRAKHQGKNQVVAA